ncbi:MAG: hypothetical protein KBT88_07835 [Gammaproteobacteria bacterium]|nr:hypothetical protein [Gammaproteobacteria bacterium]MBQ0839682.1 hypothetical protein [Gammaproteobacteria bacterium]
MPSTLIIQSHCKPLPHPWLAPCINSIKSWAKNEGFDYQFIGDEIFETLVPWVLEKTQAQRVIATDLARLKCLQQKLLSGYERVVWMDADFLIFAPERFHLPTYSELPENYALGREVWIQPKDLGENQSHKKSPKYKVYTKVHNAFLLFAQGNAFLDFYTAHAERLLKKVSGPIPPQFIGPKLLTALHNVVQCPVQESAAMLSPWVIRDILGNGGPALDLFRAKSNDAAAGANLCSSLSDSAALVDQAMDKVIARLLSDGAI